METFYGTFGMGQTLGNSYVKILAEDMQQAHQIMYENYGQMWAFAYKEKDFEQAIERHGLKEVPLGTENARRIYKETT